MNILLLSLPTTTLPIPSFKISCSAKKPPPNNNNNNNPNNNNNNSNPKDGDGFSTDWNKAWSSFKSQATGTKRRSSKFDPNKYVTWNPRPTNYPLSEEVDPIKRTEKSNLRVWTSPRFTLFGAIVVVSFLLVYTLLAPMK